MGYICSDCHSKLCKANQEARKEINRRLDNGEKEEDMCVEYENEHHKLLDAGGHDTERYYFLEAAAKICRLGLSCEKIRDAGWTLNRSGEWVRKTSTPVNAGTPKAKGFVNKLLWIVLVLAYIYLAYRFLK